MFDESDFLITKWTLSPVKMSLTLYECLVGKHTQSLGALWAGSDTP